MTCGTAANARLAAKRVLLSLLAQHMLRVADCRNTPRVLRTASLRNWNVLDTLLLVYLQVCIIVVWHCTGQRRRPKVTWVLWVICQLLKCSVVSKYVCGAVLGPMDGLHLQRPFKKTQRGKGISPTRSSNP